MNKVNLELKHYCIDFKKIRGVLKQLGAKKVIIKNQKDYFFNIPNNKKITSRLKLRIENKEQSLIYYERPDFVKNKPTSAIVKLYLIKDKELLPFLQKTLGVRAIVQKKRELWKKSNTIFHLDTVKDVGGIFEIELQKRGIISQKDKKIFKMYQKKLLPLLGPVVKGSNIDLVKKRKYF